MFDELRQSLFFKACVFATDESAFKTLCPKISHHYKAFKDIHDRTAQHVLYSYPVLCSKMSVANYFPHASLVTLMNAMNGLMEDGAREWPNFAFKHDLVIKVLVSQWKGRTSAGVSWRLYRLNASQNHYTQENYYSNWSKQTEVHIMVIGFAVSSGEEEQTDRFENISYTELEDREIMKSIFRKQVGKGSSVSLCSHLMLSVGPTLISYGLSEACVTCKLYRQTRFTCFSVVILSQHIENNLEQPQSPESVENFNVSRKHSRRQIKR